MGSKGKRTNSLNSSDDNLPQRKKNNTINKESTLQISNQFACLENSHPSRMPNLTKEEKKNKEEKKKEDEEKIQTESEMEESSDDDSVLSEGCIRNNSTNEQNGNNTTETQSTQETPLIIIITPNENDADRFFSNSIKTYRLLEKSIFGKSEILDNKSNLRRKVQVVKIGKADHLDNILKMNKLGDFDIKCRLAKERNQQTPKKIYKIGVIGPIGCGTDLDELKELIEEEGHQIYKVERLLRGRKYNYEPTKKIKIWFESEDMPESIKMMSEKFNIEPFVPKVFQCYNCQTFNHHAKYCTAKTKCILCAGEHRLAECPNKENDRKKCANCGEAHTSNYSKCPFIVKENEIQRIKAHEGVSYSDAVKKISKNTENNSNNTTPSTSQTTAPTNNIGQKQPERRYSQTVKRNEADKTTEGEKTAVPTIGPKFIAFMFEIIKELMVEKPMSEKCISVQKSMKLFYESDLDLQELQQFMDNNEQ